MKNGICVWMPFKMIVILTCATQGKVKTVYQQPPLLRFSHF